MSSSEDGPISATSADLLLASIVLMVGSSLRGYLLFPLGIPVTFVGFILVVRVVWSRSTRQVVDWTPRAGAGLFLLACVGLLAFSLRAPRWFDVVSRGYFLCGAVAVALVLGNDAATRRRAVIAMIVAATVIHMAVPIVVRDPSVDVWSLTDAAARALLHGIHPYTIPASRVYTAANSNAFSAPFYPYMPATLLVFAPAIAIVGDYRFLLAACVPVTALFLRSAARARGINDRFIDVLTLALLLHPRGFVLTLVGWTEQLMAVVASASVYWAACAESDVLASSAWFVVSALKQYMVAPPILYVLMTKPTPRLKAVGIGAAAALATVLPFLVWAWKPTWRGILFQFYDIPGPQNDAASLVSVGTKLFGVTLGRWWSVAAQLVVAGAGYWRRGRDGSVVLVSAAALYATFLFGWQAYFNYYYFVAVLLLLAAVVTDSYTIPSVALRTGR